MIDTKDKILNAAERLFGEQGYSATSLRHVISEAGVNLAAIHYHFGSKEELLDELIVRKVGPVNEQRLKNLDALEAGDAATTMAVIRAFLEPMAAVARKNQAFVKVMARVHSEGLMPQLSQRHFREVGERFVRALHRTHPELAKEELLWRVHFLMGAMGHMVNARPGSLGLDATENPAQAVEYLISFAAGAFAAPPAQLQTPEVTT